jgi:uncharacterized membrane protein YgdD (TMEM256/DUF423 family)
MTASSRIAVVAAACGAAAVALGAFGAHALRNELDAAALQTWHTAVEYQFWHAMALLAAAFAPVSRWRSASAISLALGIFVFCGSLYALALGAPRAVGAMTPLGGACFMIGWFSLAAAFWRTAR